MTHTARIITAVTLAVGALVALFGIYQGLHDTTLATVDCGSPWHPADSYTLTLAGYPITEISACEDARANADALALGTTMIGGAVILGAVTALVTGRNKTST